MPARSRCCAPWRRSRRRAATIVGPSRRTSRSAMSSTGSAVTCSRAARWTGYIGSWPPTLRSRTRWRPATYGCRRRGCTARSTSCSPRRSRPPSRRLPCRGSRTRWAWPPTRGWSGQGDKLRFPTEPKAALIEDDQAKRIADRLYGSVPTTRVTDVLSHVARWTGFTDHFRHVSTGMPPEATGVQEVNTAIAAMDGVTQQNATMVEEATAATRSLASEAEDLANQVTRFKVTQTAQANETSLSSGSVHRLQDYTQKTIRRIANAPRPSSASSPALTIASDDWSSF